MKQKKSQSIILIDFQKIKKVDFLINNLEDGL